MVEKKVIKETIMKILNQMELSVAKLIVFGSRAKGDFKENSDWDILVVLEKGVSRKEKMEIAHKIRKELAQIYIPCDVIVRSQDEVEERKEVMGSIIRSAVKTGVVL